MTLRMKILFIISAVLSGILAILYFSPQAFIFNAFTNKLGFLGRVLRQSLESLRNPKQDLKNNKERYQAILEEQTDLICRFLPGGQFTFVNDAFCLYFGQEHGAVIGSNFINFFIEDERCQFVELISSLNQNNPVATGEKRALRFNREVHWIQWTIRAIFEQRGSIIEYQAVGRDITERKRAEKIQKATYLISQAANSAITLDELYQSIHTILGELMPAFNFYIALYDPAQNILTFPYYIDQYDQAPPPQTPGRGLTEYVIKTGEAQLVSPEVADALAEQGVVDVVGTPSVDWLGVPLKTEGRVIGVMVVQTYTEGIRFGEEETNLMKFVSSQVAMAIERKRAESAIRESEERFRTLFENAPVGIYRISPDGHFLMANPYLVQLLGFNDFADFQSHSFEKEGFLHSSFRSHFLETIQQNGQVTGLESVWFKKDGTIIRVRENARIIKNPEGLPLFYEGIVEDITERMQAEEALRASEARYRRIFEDSPISLWEQDFSELKAFIDQLRQQGVEDFRTFFNEHFELVAEISRHIKVLDVNKTTLRMYHAENKELLLMHPDLLLDNESLSMVRDGLVAISDGKTEFEGEGVIHDLEGNPIQIQLYWSVAPGYEDTLSNVIVNVIDITPRKKAEEALLRRAEELSVLHAVAKAGTEAIDEDDLIERATEVIGETLYPDQCGIFLIDPGSDTLRCHPSYRGISDDEKRIHMRIGEGVTGRVALTGETIRVKDVSLDPIYFRVGYQKMYSELCVPIKVGDRVIGVINAETSQPNFFSEADEHLLAILSGQLATAIDRLRTEAIERQHAQQLATIYDVSQEIVGTSLDPEKVYIAIHQAVGKLMPGEAFIITLIDEAANEIEAVYQVDHSGRFPRARFPLTRGFSGHVIQKGQSIKIDDFDLVSSSLDAIHFGDEEHVRSILAVPMRMGGKIIGSLSAQSYRVHAYTDADLHLLELLTAHAAIALGNAHLYKETVERADELAVLVKVSSALRIALTRSEMMPIILNQLCELLKIKSAAIVLNDPSTNEPLFELALGSWARCTGLRLPVGDSLLGRVIKDQKPCTNMDVREDARARYLELMDGDYIASAAPLFAQEQIIGALWVGCHSDFTREEMRLLNMIADIAANAIHRSTLYEETQRHAEQMATASATGRALAETLDLSEIYARLAQSIQELIPDIHSVHILLFDRSRQNIHYAYSMKNDIRIDISDIPEVQLGEPETALLDMVIQTQKPYIISANQLVSGELNPILQGGDAKSGLFVPMISKGETLGVIYAQSRLLNRFKQPDAELLTLVGNTAAIAIENARLFTETERRLRRLAALRAMDMAISSSFDLRVTLNVLLDQITAQLGIDAASVLLFNNHSQNLEYSTGRGFRGTGISHTRMRLDEDLPGRAAMERHAVTNLDFPQFSLRSRRLMGEDFVSYYGIPLIAKGQLKGVLEIFNRSPLNPDPEWIEFLETLAGDTAIAIDNTSMFNDLQRSNIELTLAYDTTLEGWSRVLELRDQETEGHTQRVVDLTLALGRAIGIPDHELVDLRRGVLMHDIGKMGVPDNILHKSGPLNEEEWKIMRMHPLYAYDMLSPIPYLRMALDIPYCHHEKWDGSGYPRGLKGNDIPLSSRIFAVVDVWDALCSNRPYRPAWTQQQAIDYICQESGKHFDPVVVDAFLKILSEMK